MNDEQHQVAGWVEAPGPDSHVIVRRDIPVKKPAADEVLIKVECTGLCHSDVHRMFGDRPLLTGILGHEGVGRVVEVGSSVYKDLLNRRVGVGWLGSACMKCDICAVDYTACPCQKNPGRDIPGTFQQYMSAPADFVTIIPEQLSSEVAAPILCAGVTMYSAIRKAALPPNAWVVIQGGAGGLGHFGIQICKKWGYRTIAVDGGDGKRELCSRLGATNFVDFEKEDVAAVVSDLTGGYGAHAVFCTPGTTTAYTQAMSLVRRLGTVSCLGLIPSQIPVSPRELATWGIKITGSTVGTLKEIEALMDMVVSGDVIVAVQTFDFDKLDELIYEMKNHRVVGRAVVRLPQ